VQINNPDLVLLDLTLPDMDPVQMISQARQAGAATPPIIVVSARASGFISEAAREIGAASVLHKPFLISALLGNIEQVLG
jgi:DNA-binding response OmpR family regulator